MPEQGVRGRQHPGRHRALPRDREQELAEPLAPECFEHQDLCRPSQRRGQLIPRSAPLEPEAQEARR
eukprot:9478015-Alexandrium_andersonii.AAC.1